MRNDRNTRVLCVAPALFGKLLQRCGDMLTRGVQISGDMGDVIERIEQGNLQVWLVTDGQDVLATCFTDINEEDSGARFVCVYGLVGKGIDRWARQLSDTLADFARAELCARVLFAGRPGWARVLPEYKQVDRRNGELVWERRVAA